MPTCSVVEKKHICHWAESVSMGFCHIDENAPSTGTERIDRIGQCHSNLQDASFSPSKTAVLVILPSLGDTQFMISPHCTPAPDATPGHCTIVRDVMNADRAGIIPTLRRIHKFYVENFHWLCIVQCALKVVETREEY